MVLADYSEMKENSCLPQLPNPREEGLKAPLKLHVELGLMELSQALCSCQQPETGIPAPRCRRPSMRWGFLGTEAGEFECLPGQLLRKEAEFWPTPNWCTATDISSVDNLSIGNLLWQELLASVTRFGVYAMCSISLIRLYSAIKIWSIAGTELSWGICFGRSLFG